MTNWRFGDVVEWDISSGVIRWLIICPKYDGLGYKAIWVSGGSGRCTDRRVTDILEAPQHDEKYRLVSDG